MSVFIGEKNKRVELAERKDAINPNLLLNSRDFSANWLIGNAEVTNDSYCGGKVVSLHANGDGSNDVRQQVQTPPSLTVTWSVYAKADNAGDKLHTELFNGGGRPDQVLTTDWNRYTFQGISDPTNCTLYFWGVSGNKGDIYIALPKLEIGNTATPWCPAYEDYASNSGFNSLQNAVNSKVNVDAPLYHQMSKNDTWADIIGTANNNTRILTALRDDTSGDGPTAGSNGSGIAFGGSDTKGVLSVNWLHNIARIAAGNGDKPSWSEDIAWKSDITNLQNTVNQQSQTIQSLTTRLTNVENEISYIKANYIEGKQFPASQEAQAVAWENANPQGIAFITSN